MVLHEVEKFELDGWMCSILDNVNEGWSLAVCWTKGGRKQVAIPARVFETCNEELFRDYGLPEYVSRRLASVCRMYRIVKARSRV